MIYTYFYLKSFRKRKDGLTPLVLRVTVNGTRQEIPLGIGVDEEIWDPVKQMATGTRAHATRVNALVQHSYARLLELYHKMLMDGPVHAKQLKAEFVNQKPQQEAKSVLDLFEEHNTRFQERVDAGDLHQATLTKYRTVLKHLRKFYAQNSSLTPDVRKIDIRVVEDFDHFVRVKLGVKNNTAVKYVATLATILRIARRYGHVDHVATDGYRGQSTKRDPTYLTQSELELIEHLELDNKSLERVRDFFIFSCYTGLAYADIYKLEMDDIVEGADGTPWINAHRSKTNIPVHVPILPVPQSIIDKYEREREIVGDGRAFPMPSNQKVNQYLKVIAMVAGLNKRLTYHVARHTFATTVTLTNNVPIESVSRMLGHTNLKMTQHYARVVDMKISEDMSNLKSKLESRKKS